MSFRGITADAEWWRGGPRQAKILKAFEVEAMTERLARSAGEAIAAVPGTTVVDAIVMASAAARGAWSTRPILTI
jgi:hypothetical protein